MNFNSAEINLLYLNTIILKGYKFGQAVSTYKLTLNTMRRGITTGNQLIVQYFNLYMHFYN